MLGLEGNPATLPGMAGPGDMRGGGSPEDGKVFMACQHGCSSVHVK